MMRYPLNFPHTLNSFTLNARKSSRPFGRASRMESPFGALSRNSWKPYEVASEAKVAGGSGEVALAGCVYTSQG